MGEWIALEGAKFPYTPGLYIIRDTSNGKEYVGLSIEVGRRVKVHGRAKSKTSLLHRAIRAHGIGFFQVCFYLSGTFEELPELERLLIEERKTMLPAGYNLTEGGEGTWGRECSDEQKELLRQKAKGRKMSEETKAKLSKVQEGFWTAERRQRAGEFSRMKTMSEEGKIGVAKANRARSQAVKDKFSKANLGLSGNLSVHSKPVAVWTTDSMVPKIFECTVEASKWLGCFPCRISEYCRGKFKPRNGWVWAYL